MYKKIIFSLFLGLAFLVQAQTNASIDFNKQLPMAGPIYLKVVNVAADDLLNVRLKADFNSSIVATLAPDAQGFYTFDKDLSQKLGKNTWLEIELNNAGQKLKGWVKASFVSAQERYLSFANDNFSISYPYFLLANSENIKQGLGFYYGISLKHYSACDARANPDILEIKELLGLSFKVFVSLKEALKADFPWYFNNNLAAQELSYDANFDWFMASGNDFVWPVNYHGKDASRIEIGLEGCGIIYYYYRQAGKVVVISQRFDINPAINPDTNEIIDLSANTMPDKENVIVYLMENLEIK